MSGVHEHDGEGSTFEQVVEGLPVIARRLHHDEGHLRLDQVVAQGEDLVRHGPPRGHRRAGLSATGTGYPHADLGVFLRDVDPRTARVDDFHRISSRWCPSRGGQGEDQESDARAHGNNPRFPWEPSTTMLNYRLSGTTEASASFRADGTSLTERTRWRSGPRRANATHNLRSPRRAHKALYVAEMENHLDLPGSRDKSATTRCSGWPA